MPRPRIPSRISESLHQRLNSYALAASAAGVSLLALAQPAEARIVYTRAHHTFRPGYYSFDLNHDGVTDFVFHLSIYHSVSELRIQPHRSKNQIWGYSATGRKGRIGFASALGSGVRVHSSTKLQPGHEVMTWRWTTNNTKSYSSGPWLNVKKGYLGLKFYIHGKAHYGWAQLKNSGRTLTGYAYETVPNKSIKTGKTHGPDVITVHDASLGHLARGAAAIPAWRNKEQ
jgi:hypothetical protein